MYCEEVVIGIRIQAGWDKMSMLKLQYIIPLASEQLTEQDMYKST